MIKYKYPEEKTILVHYAKSFNDQLALSIIENDEAKNADEAAHLANFFWRMVDQTVIDIENKKSIANQNNLEQWCEYIMHTLRVYFIAAGFLNEWDIESDKA